MYDETLIAIYISANLQSWYILIRPAAYRIPQLKETINFKLIAL